MIQSDASEVLHLRWDDRTFVVDPKCRVRHGSTEPVEHGSPSRSALDHQLGEPVEAVTLEEWAFANGYDPVTRTYAS